MRVRHLPIAAVILLGGRIVSAQSASEHIALGDRAHDEMRAVEALGHYEQALKADATNYEALWKASRESVDLAEFDADHDDASKRFKDGELYARRAIASRPDDAEGHFYRARALGKVALTLGTRERIRYAKDVRNEALAALKINPNHPGALHVMGRWNAEVMRLNGMSRFIAKNFLGGAIFNSASWEDAVKYMERSVAADPNRLTHHLDLGEIYADLGQPAKAREQFEIVVKGQATDFNDAHYKREAAERLKGLS
ncbi:MAG: tetratricopeptide repeat protein [Gemmatimonadota bacterium]|nr:tetratricopeptide repeat protein [Gemmatimonadota bacterium]